MATTLLTKARLLSALCRDEGTMPAEVAAEVRVEAGAEVEVEADVEAARATEAA